MSVQRIQRRRSRGWRMPPNTIYVGRPSRWGNPVHWHPMPTYHPDTDRTTPADPAEARRIATEGFENVLGDPSLRDLHGYPSDEEIRAHLGGKDLACWCPVDHRCHADVLLDIANRGADLDAHHLLETSQTEASTSVK